MSDTTELKAQVKQMLVDSLLLQLAPADIGDDQALFGPDSMGLDSVDALQVVVALDKKFGLKIPDPATARGVLRCVNTMVAELEKRGLTTVKSATPN